MNDGGTRLLPDGGDAGRPSPSTSRSRRSCWRPLELLDPESETYALDVISLVEATLEDPRQILRAQQRQERDARHGSA